MKASIRHCIVLLACLLAAACSRIAEELDDDTHAEAAHVSVVEQAPGPTPFIVNLALRREDIANLDRVSFTIAAMPGTFSKPVAVTYTRAWFDRTGAWHPADKRLAFPVFGLYANYRNSVTLTVHFRDASTHVERLSLAAPAYDGRPPSITRPWFRPHAARPFPPASTI